MTNHGAVAISSSIMFLACTLIVGIGINAGTEDRNTLVGVGAILALLSFIVWVASVTAMQRQRSP